jgi:hypothetical protein
MVELAPGLLPALRERGGGDLEMEAELALAGVVGVDGVTAVDLLDAHREQVEQLGELGLASGYEDAPQRNALLSFSKKPSSAV